MTPSPKPPPREKRKPRGLSRKTALPRATKPMARGSKLARSRKRIAPRRKRFADTKHWEATRAAVYARQRGLCARCQRALNLHGENVMCGSHVEPLRMGGCRDDAENERNHPDNIAGLCWRDDSWFESLPVPARKREVAKWKARGTWDPSEILHGHGSRRTGSIG